MLAQGGPAPGGARRTTDRENLRASRRSLPRRSIVAALPLPLPLPLPEIAAGWTTESAAILDVCLRLKLVASEPHHAGKAMLDRIMAMLVKLAKSLGEGRSGAGAGAGAFVPPSSPAAPGGARTTSRRRFASGRSSFVPRASGLRARPAPRACEGTPRERVGFLHTLRVQTARHRARSARLRNAAVDAFRHLFESRIPDLTREVRFARPPVRTGHRRVRRTWKGAVT